MQPGDLDHHPNRPSNGRSASPAEVEQGSAAPRPSGTQTDPHRRDRFHPADQFLARVNLEPGRTTARPASAELVHELSGALDSMEALREDGVDALHDLVPHVDRRPRRRILLPLKRAIHRRQAVDDHLIDGLEAVLASSGAATDDHIGTLGAVAASLRRINDTEQRLLETSDRGAEEERQALAEIAERSTFQMALTTSGPRLQPLADRYAAATRDGARIRAKDEATLLYYAMRAGMKTSPFSWYTKVVTASWQPDSPTGLATVLDCETSVAVELARPVVSFVASQGVARSWPNVLLSLHPDVELTDRELLYPARFASGLAEPQRIPLTGAVRAIIGFLTSSCGVTTSGELAAFLTGCGAADPATVIGKFLAVGVLRAEVEGEDDHDIAGLPLLRSLPDLAGDDRLDSLATLLSTYPTSRSGPERLRIRQAIDDRVADLAGSPVPPGIPTFFEDVYCPETLAIAPDRFSGALSDLGRLLGLLELFDERHVLNLVLADRIRPLVEARGPIPVADLEDEFTDAYTLALQIVDRVADVDRLGIPELVELEQTKAALSAPYEDRARHRAPVIELTDHDLALARRRRPPWLDRRPASYDVFVQPIHPERLVINKVYGGWLNYYSRFLRPDIPNLVEGARSHLAGIAPGELVEMRPINGFNANIHPLLTDGELRRAAKLRPGDLPLEELCIGLDDHALPDLRLGDRRITPLYLGFLVAIYLPRLERTIAALTPNGSIIFEPQVLAEREATRAEPETFTRTARIDHRGVTLARARWSGPARELTDLLEEGREPTWMTEVTRWRHRHGIPREVFVKPPMPDLETDPGDGISALFERRKPQYVDFASRLALQHLRRSLARLESERIVFEEALPSPSTFLVDASGVGRASELVIEYSRSADATS